MRALKSQRMQAIYEAGLMPSDSVKDIRQVYFEGDMEAATALAGETGGLIHEILPGAQTIDGAGFGESKRVTIRVRSKG